METTQENKKRIVERYTIGEAIERAGAATTSGISGQYDRTSRDPGHDIWGGCTFEQSQELALNGYPQGAATLKHRVGTMAAIRHSMRPTPRWDTAGSAIDVGRFMSGEPENMIETIRTARPSPVVKINVERCVHGGTPTSEIEATGASVLFVVEAMRTAGIPAEIWASFTIRSGGGFGGADDTISAQVCIQRPGAPIDVDRLAYWLVHPGALRRTGFALWEHQPKRIRDKFRIKSHGGYGYPHQLPMPEFDETAPAGRAAATDWMVDVLARRVGITLKPEDYR